MLLGEQRLCKLSIVPCAGILKLLWMPAHQQHCTTYLFPQAPSQTLQQSFRRVAACTKHHNLQATVDDLMQALYDESDRKAKFKPAQQRLTLPPKEGAKSGEVLARGKSISDYNLSEGSVVLWKDLGPQVCCTIS
jgi:hypothetical protein